MNRKAFQLFPILQIQKINKDISDSNNKPKIRVNSFDMKILKEIEKRLYFKPRNNKDQSTDKNSHMLNSSNIQFENKMLNALNENVILNNNDISPINNISNYSNCQDSSSKLLKSMSLFQEYKRNYYKRSDYVNKKSLSSFKLTNQKDASCINISLSREIKNQKETINNRFNCLPNCDKLSFNKKPPDEDNGYIYKRINDIPSNNENQFKKRSSVGDTFMLICKRNTKRHNGLMIPITRNSSFEGNKKVYLTKPKIKLLKIPQTSLENYLLGDCAYMIGSKERQKEKLSHINN